MLINKIFYSFVSTINTTQLEELTRLAKEVEYADINLNKESKSKAERNLEQECREVVTSMTERDQLYIERYLN